jgi:HPt (histidine-containing phosphotransfer) domain-containing protein
LLAEIERFSRRPEPAPPMAPPPSRVDCIDWQAAWTNLEGDRNLLSELARMFLNDLPQQMEAIHLAVDNRQDHELERLAHRLKASVGNFAAKPAFEAAFRLEKVALHGDLKLALQAVDVLEYEIRRLRGALEEWAHKPPGIDGAGSPLAAPSSSESSSSGLTSASG